MGGWDVLLEYRNGSIKWTFDCTHQAIMPIFNFKKHSLRTRDDERTKASELTVKQSLYPLCLVTILFFLWASHQAIYLQSIQMRSNSSYSGVFLWTPRYSEQTFPNHPGYIQSPLEWPPGRLLWSVIPLMSTWYTPDHLLLGAYPLASLGHANYILRHFGYKAVFIWGLALYGIGALIAWPCLLHRSFGGFCAAIFVIGNGLGSLETAANPYLAGTQHPCRVHLSRPTQADWV